jgi:hypothetical protein
MQITVIQGRSDPSLLIAMLPIAEAGVRGFAAAEGRSGKFNCRLHPQKRPLSDLFGFLILPLA